MKLIAIIGASDGIGAEMARQLATTHGSDLSLVLAARNEALRHEVAAPCAVHGSRTLVVKTDVSVEAKCRRLMETATETFGRIDALINNAGTSGLKEGAMSVEACARLILQGMRRREREVVMTVRVRLDRWLQLTAPGKVEAMALAALKDGAKPH